VRTSQDQLFESVKDFSPTASLSKDFQPASHSHVEPLALIDSVNNPQLEQPKPTHSSSSSLNIFSSDSGNASNNAVEDTTTEPIENYSFPATENNYALNSFPYSAIGDVIYNDPHIQTPFTEPQHFTCNNSSEFIHFEQPIQFSSGQPTQHPSEPTQLSSELTQLHVGHTTPFFQPTPSFQPIILTGFHHLPNSESDYTVDGFLEDYPDFPYGFSGNNDRAST
jgi:hypothetical protein